MKTCTSECRKLSAAEVVKRRKGYKSFPASLGGISAEVSWEPISLPEGARPGLVYYRLFAKASVLFPPPVQWMQIVGVANQRVEGKPGGTRRYFVCPHCGKTAQSLYLEPNGRCRWLCWRGTCHDLCFPSQHVRHPKIQAALDAAEVGIAQMLAEPAEPFMERVERLYRKRLSAKF